MPSCVPILAICLLMEQLLFRGPGLRDAFRLALALVPWWLLAPTASTFIGVAFGVGVGWAYATGFAAAGGWVLFRSFSTRVVLEMVHEDAGAPADGKLVVRNVFRTVRFSLVEVTDVFDQPFFFGKGTECVGLGLSGRRRVIMLHATTAVGRQLAVHRSAISHVVLKSARHRLSGKQGPRARPAVDDPP